MGRHDGSPHAGSRRSRSASNGICAGHDNPPVDNSAICASASLGAEFAPHDIGLARERLRRGEERLEAPGQVAETVDSHGPSIRRSIRAGSQHGARSGLRWPHTHGAAEHLIEPACCGRNGSTPPSSSGSCGEGMYGSQVEPALPQRDHGANSRDTTETPATTPPTQPRRPRHAVPRHPRRRLHPRQRARSRRRHTSNFRKRKLGTIGRELSSARREVS